MSPHGRLFRIVALLTAIMWQLCSAAVAAHETSEAFAHAGEDPAGVHSLLDVEPNDDSSEGQVEKGEQDHPAHAPCGPCHGHALGISSDLDRIGAPVVSGFVLVHRAGPLPSRPDGLFRPPRV
ncbi:hypothetical protein [Parvularcula dongshanensis]|uniref:Cytochrome c553 n=1 Tax=Parvularcula dongshanensis TaxID=1173995 RepID=A0A840I8D8_9PROT|nr:hypothetical protein [Parvularcula dongshanensis]MBB4660220.1 cytochrome c553 [Parvularcula dongshanensis]